MQIKSVGSTKTCSGKCLPSALSPAFFFKTASASVPHMPSKEAVKKKKKTAVPITISGYPCGLLLGLPLSYHQGLTQCFSSVWKCLLHVWAITGSVFLVTTVGSLQGFFSRRIFSTALLSVNHSAYNEAKDLVSSHHHLFLVLLHFLLLPWFRVEMEPRTPCILAQSYNLRL